MKREMAIAPGNIIELKTKRLGKWGSSANKTPHHANVAATLQSPPRALEGVGTFNQAWTRCLRAGGSCISTPACSRWLPSCVSPVIGGQNVRNNDALQLIVYLPWTPLRRVIVYDTDIYFFVFILIYLTELLSSWPCSGALPRAELWRH